jgi:hypothetical protein
MIYLSASTYSLTINATKRELQELSCVLDRYLEDEHHTSGDNPAWKFMKELAATLDKL